MPIKINQLQTIKEDEFLTIPLKDPIPKEKVSWFKKITVEPALFLFMFASMTINVTEQDFVLDRICRVDKNFSSYICDNIRNESFQTYKHEIQESITWYFQWQSILSQLLPIGIAPFLGPFSDRYGRKLPFIMGLSGKLIYSIMVIFNIRMTNLSTNYILWTAVIPASLTGTETAIFSSASAYITDITTKENRTFRVTISDSSYLLSVPFGLLLGPYMFKNMFNQSFALLFIFNSFLLSIAIIYSFIVLEWRTKEEQKPLIELTQKGILSEFFNSRNLKDSIDLITKKRGVEMKRFMILILILMALFCLYRIESVYMYVTTMNKFNWSADEFSVFKTVRSIVYALSSLIIVPILTQKMKMKDVIVAAIGISSNILSRLLFIFTHSPVVFYIGGIIAGFGPIANPMIKSIMSKKIHDEDRGKAFTILSVCDNCIPILSGSIYSVFYRLTYPEREGVGIFGVTIVTQTIVLILLSLLSNMKPIPNGTNV